MAGFVQIRGEVLDYDQRVEMLSDRAYRLFMMTFYSRGRSMLGLSRWVPGDALARVQGWQIADVEAALDELLRAGLVDYDFDARVLYNPFVLEFTQPSGPNQIRGAATVLRELPDTPVLIPAMEIVLETLKKAVQNDPPKDIAESKKEIERRLSTLKAAAQEAGDPCQGVAGPLPRGCQGVSKGLPDPCQGVAQGLTGETGEDLEHTPTSGCGENEAPKCGNEPQPLPMGSQGVSKGLLDPCQGVAQGSSRARAYARPDKEKDTEKDKEKGETPQTPLEGGQESGQGEKEPKGQGRVSEYAKLG